MDVLSAPSPHGRGGVRGLAAWCIALKPLTLTLSQREGPPFMRRPSADAVAGNGGDVNLSPLRRRRRGGRGTGTHGHAGPLVLHYGNPGPATKARKTTR
jgi:hypothetical protein